jgi:hypothetical protein
MNHYDVYADIRNVLTRCEMERSKADIFVRNNKPDAPNYLYYSGLIRYLDGKIDGLKISLEIIRQDLRYKTLEERERELYG